MTPRLWLDCDGVLADFDAGFRQAFLGYDPGEYEKEFGSATFWDAISRVPNFYRNLPVMPWAHSLVARLIKYRPVILTGCPMGGWAQAQKVEWAAEHFPSLPMVTCMARHKSRFCVPGDVLVDDRDHYRHLWEEYGGTFVHYLGGVDDTVRQVTEAMPRC